MAPNDSSKDERAFTYLVGIGVTHSIAPLMHDFIAQSLGYNWKFIAQECPTVEDAMALFRKPTFAGGVVTMPYKGTIIKHLDGLDEHAATIGACNNVYRASDGSLRGTNTDWRGIKGSLSDGDSQGKGKGRPALVIGAGGASRAALYALYDQLQCNPIYIVNRDAGEVDALRKDAEVYGDRIKIVWVRSVEEGKSLVAPFYIVGTVPDFEPQSPEEIAGRDVIEYLLSSTSEKGILLDMCFKPRRTRWLKLAEKHGWKTIEGTGIIGHQIEEQYRLWVGEDTAKRIDVDAARAVLQNAAETSPAINF
ncbi:hypothetical protein H2204_009971 [Knufia peltigerae]|uniref:Shikimate dehydrogenase substrate binding N-terminal domain-containing protein n=1 Tax=Knufia peltigerae TaxID=1002370 RepID=A0AA38XWY7_9EURO|nr:hypothetical protein H2204_009971 [Knufia peltigerae]